MSTQLELPMLLASGAFSADDLACNRRGALSPAQEAWRREHPAFMLHDDGEIEVLRGRVAIEGRYFEGKMGHTEFASLALRGRRYRLSPRLDRLLVHDAPYKAYTAYGWIWSIEPVSEEELHEAGGSEIAHYRSNAAGTSLTTIRESLAKALANEIAFSDDDFETNEAGRISPAQRRRARAMFTRGVWRVALAILGFVGFGAVVATSRVVFPVLMVAAVGSLSVVLLKGIARMAEHVPTLLARRPASMTATIVGRGPNSTIVLSDNETSVRVSAGAFAIPEAPLARLSSWKFKVHYVPWTRAVLSVRPIAPDGERA